MRTSTVVNAALLAGACAIAVLLRLSALDMPLDRDLAAYATIGQNLNDGVFPTATSSTTSSR
jgi:hypothetical protein